MIMTRVIKNTVSAHNIPTGAIISLTKNSLSICIFFNTRQLARLHWVGAFQPVKEASACVNNRLSVNMRGRSAVIHLGWSGESQAISLRRWCWMQMWSHKQECLQLPLPKTTRMRRRGAWWRTMEEKKVKKKVFLGGEKQQDWFKDRTGEKTTRQDRLLQSKWLRMKQKRRESHRGATEQQVWWCDKQPLTPRSSLHPVIQDFIAQRWVHLREPADALVANADSSSHTRIYKGSNKRNEGAIIHGIEGEWLNEVMQEAEQTSRLKSKDINSQSKWRANSQVGT